MRSILWRRAVQGAVLALGAPAGWLVLRLLSGEKLVSELSSNTSLYLYLLIPTMIAFSGFGVLIGLHEDKLEIANQMLEELALTDSLTGLKNVRYFHLRLEEEHALALREQTPLAIAVIDLDHFKRVNDRFGHRTGDDLLRACGRAILSVVRKGETAARVGGEEFALLLPGSDGSLAAQVGERVRSAIAATTLPTKNGEVRITTSVGVATTAELGVLDPQLLYQAADAALYRAKRNGRDRVVVLDDTEQAQIEATLGDRDIGGERSAEL